MNSQRLPAAPLSGNTAAYFLSPGSMTIAESQAANRREGPERHAPTCFSTLWRTVQHSQLTTCWFGLSILETPLRPIRARHACLPWTQHLTKASRKSISGNIQGRPMKNNTQPPHVCTATSAIATRFFGAYFARRQAAGSCTHERSKSRPHAT
jgi:hypothetical protein